MATVTPSNLACEESGCPVLGLAAGERADSAVYPDLARANLLRMRGQYAAAKDLCLSILRRHPGNVTAHTLLGDLGAEQGDLAQAAEWYELALDLDPTSTGDLAKLEEVRRRAQREEVADTAKQIGIPEAAPRARLYQGLAIAFVTVVGVAAFFLGQAIRANQEPPPVPVESIALDQPSERRSEPMPAAPGSVATTPGRSETPSEAPAHPNPLENREDAELLAQVRGLREGSGLASAWVDPRTGAIAVTFTVEEGGDPSAISLALGRAILAARTAAPKVTLRAQMGDLIVYVADLERANLPAEGAEPAEGTRPLTNEWRR